MSAGDCPAAPAGTPHVTDDAGVRCLRCHNELPRSRWADWSAEDLGQEVARLVTDMARSRDSTIDELHRRNEALERELQTQREVANGRQERERP